MATQITTGQIKDGAVTVPKITIGANLPMNGNKITGLSVATANGEAVRYDEFNSLVTDNDFVLMSALRNLYNY